MIGPKHYEGWTCKGCNYLDISSYYTKTYYCSKVMMSSYLDNNLETPNWCPYIKQAIIEHITWGNHESR